MTWFGLNGRASAGAGAAVAAAGTATPLMLVLTSVLGLSSCATSPPPPRSHRASPGTASAPALPVVEWSSPGEGPRQLPDNTSAGSVGSAAPQNGTASPTTSIALRARPVPSPDDGAPFEIADDAEAVPAPPEATPAAQSAQGAAGSPREPLPTLKTTCEARVGENGVRRSALDETLDAGLGRWLRGIDVEPQMKGGRFEGWRVKGLFAGDPCWSGIDLRVGDVVKRVNRRPIERPEQAQAVWSGPAPGWRDRRRFQARRQIAPDPVRRRRRPVVERTRGALAPARPPRVAGGGEGALAMLLGAWRPSSWRPSSWRPSPWRSRRRWPWRTGLGGLRLGLFLARFLLASAGLGRSLAALLALAGFRLGGLGGLLLRLFGRLRLGRGLRRRPPPASLWAASSSALAAAAAWAASSAARFFPRIEMNATATSATTTAATMPMMIRRLPPPISSSTSASLIRSPGTARWRPDFCPGPTGPEPSENFWRSSGVTVPSST